MVVHSRIFYVQALAMAALSFLARTTYANLATCQQQSQNAVQQCQNAASQAEASKNANAAQASSAAGASGMNQNGFNLGSVTSAAAALDNGVKTTCTNLKSSGCDQPCSSCSSQEQAQCTQAKNQCDQKVQSQADKSAQSAAQNSGNSGQSNNSGEQAATPAMPAPSPPAASPASTPDTAATASSTSDTAATSSATATPYSNGASTVGYGASNCASETAYTIASCTSTLAQQCNGKFAASAVCQSFSSRYCSTSGSTGEASQGASQAGEGVGTSFCSSYLASNSSFSCSTPGTESCPSCSGVAPVAGQTVPSACANDPAFSNPKIASPTLSTSTSSGGSSGSSGGGTSLSALSGLTQKTSSDPKLNTDLAGSSVKEGGSLAVDGGGGGGGSGGSYGSSIGTIDFLKNSTSGKASASRKVASATASASDVQVQQGPSVFSISSEILRNRCQSGRLLHCGPSAK